MKLKILQVTRDAVDTGGGKVALETSLFMLKAGHDVLIVTDSELNEKDCDYVVTDFGQKLKLWSPKYKILRVIRHFLQIMAFTIYSNRIINKKRKEGWLVINHNIEATKGDIIVLHNVFQAEHMNDHRGSIKKNIRWLNPVFMLRIIKEKIVLKNFKHGAIVGVSKATLKEAEPYIRKEIIKKSINNGVDIDYFHPLFGEERDKLRALKKMDNKFALLFVGHEFERKGLLSIIEGMSLLPDFVELWVIGGRGSSKNIYIEAADKLKLLNRVHFLGTILDTREYYQACDAFILPSMYEAWPLVGLEAMACGTPALMTSVGGISEFLFHNKNGLIIERNGEDIARGVQKLINDSNFLCNLRECARNVAINHSWQRTAAEYIELARTVKKQKL